jgi:hypothetical protein
VIDWKIWSVNASFLIQIEADCCIASGALGVVVDTIETVDVEAIQSRVVIVVHASSSRKLRFADANVVAGEVGGVVVCGTEGANS